MKNFLFICLFFFGLMIGEFVSAAVTDSIDTEIKKNIELSKKYELRIDQRAIATMHVFILREAKNSCSYQSDNPAKQTNCLQRALSRAKPSATELCLSVKENIIAYTSCLRGYIQSFKPGLENDCSGLTTYQARPCKESAKSTEETYKLLVENYNKDAVGREKREAKSKTIDYIPDSTFQTKLMAFSESRQTKNTREAGFFSGGRL